MKQERWWEASWLAPGSPGSGSTMEMVPSGGPWDPPTAATAPKITFTLMENGCQQWFRWNIDPLNSADFSDKLKHQCRCMSWEEKFRLCAQGLLFCGETSTWNPAAWKAPDTGLSAATSGKSSVSNPVQGLMELRLKYGWEGKIKPFTGNIGVILQQDMMKFSIQTRGRCSSVALAC